MLLIAQILVAGDGLGALASARAQGTKATELPARFVERTFYEGVAFAPNGRIVVLVKEEGVVAFCDLTTGRAEMVMKPFTGKQRSTKVAYSQDGRLLAIASEPQGIVIWDAETMQEKGRIPLSRAGVYDMVFIDGDRTLGALVGTRQGNHLFARWEVPSGVPRGTRDLGKAPFFEVLSPDGRYAVFRSVYNDVILRHIVDEYAVFELTSGRKVFELKPVGGWIFSRDGSTLISCEENRLSIRELPSGKELKHFLVSPELGLKESPQLSLSADGKLLAVQAYPEDRLAGLISLETGKLLDRVECGPPLSMCNLVRLSPDGRILATRTNGVNTKDQPVKPILKLWRLPASW